MPSIEQKVQSYLNFSKNGISLNDKSKGKPSLNDIKDDDMLAKEILAKHSSDEDFAKARSNAEDDLSKKKSDEAESIFKGSNHELKKKPLK